MKEQVIPVTEKLLKSFEALANVPDEQLSWMIQNSANNVIPDEKTFITEGQLIDGPHIIINGRVDLTMNQNGASREIAVIGIGDIFGYLPFSRGEISNINCQAIGSVQLLTFPTDKIREMIRDHFELTQALVHVMSNRVKSLTSIQQQNEKMMALGKLSAGLTHELNNPASAIVRDSVSLREHLRLEPETFKEVIAMRLEPAEVDGLNAELFRLLSEKDRPHLTLREKNRREEELGKWLEDQGITEWEDMSEVFVDFNFDLGNLNDFLKYIPKSYLTPVFNWITRLLITEKMVEDIQESSRRIADLLQSVKVFTHMDRGTDKQVADIHIGIRNTLTMLGHKVRKNNVILQEIYDETLPPVKAYIGELNQVWTNLIDNALDAMENTEKPTLTIKTERDRGFVQVTIGDNGPGIPQEIRSKIFDPFFTTKEMGKGTGLGLEVVQRIVLQHRGSVKVISAPGKTEFIVCFLIDG